MDQDRDNMTPGAERGDASYSDAYYREAPDERRACYGYSPAQCYARASDPPQPKTQRSGNGRTGIGAMITLICAIFVLTAALLISSGLFFSSPVSASGEAAESNELYEEYTATVTYAEDPALPLEYHSVDEAETLSAEEIYVSACQFTVGVAIPGYSANIFGQSSAATVTGTGIILSEDGYILTNYHVIETAYETGAALRILTFEGLEYDAEVIGVETDSDLAVLKIEAYGLVPAVLGNSDEMRVGQTIYTVGNPLGELTYTMTSGIISALNRRITTDEDVTVNMFQIDAAVNNGNSGGPVFNACGQVIGVVTAKYSLDGMEGLGFAIPINDACSIAFDLVEKGYVSGKAYLGLQFADVSPTVAQYYDMVQGVYICSVEPGSCAEEAGLQNGDIIVAIDGKSVGTSTELVQAVREYRAGDSAELSVWRGKETVSVTVVFDEELPAERMESAEPTGEIIYREG